MKNRTRPRTTYWMIAAATVVIVLGATLARTARDQAPATAATRTQPADSRQQAADFIRYYHSIVLTPEQEAIKSAALSAIPAPCCRNYSIATCCCPCNLAKSVWGLAHFLIAKQGYSASQVKTAVEEWLRSSNPGAYSGDACFTHGCNRSLDHNGCGGMDEKRIS